MIGYVTLGSNDMTRAAAFYDELFAVIGAGRFMEAESFVAWAVAPDQPALGLRGDSNFYVGYFRDLDGNKLNCYCWQAA